MELIVIILSLILGAAALIILGLYFSRVSEELSEDFEYGNFFRRQEYIYRSQRVRDFATGVFVNIATVGVNIFMIGRLVPGWLLAVGLSFIGLALLYTRKFLGFGFLSILIFLPLVFVFELARDAGLLGLVLLIAIIIIAPILFRQIRRRRV